MKYNLVLFFILLGLFHNAQVEIKPLKGQGGREEFKGLKKIELLSEEVECTNSPERIFLINSKSELSNFYARYKLDVPECADRNLNVDFNSYSIVYIGLGLGANQQFVTEFYTNGEVLQIGIEIITPSNIDLSQIMDLKYFIIEKKYANHEPKVFYWLKITD